MARELESDLTIPMSLPGALALEPRPTSLLAGRYELLGMLGVGGMGAVYRARDLELDELVALKMLSSELALAPGMIERFREEVRLARRVTHPNIARGLALLGDWPAAAEVFLSASLDPAQAPTGWMSAIRLALWYGDRERADVFVSRFAAEISQPEPRLAKIIGGLHDVLRIGDASVLDAALTMSLRVPRSQASFAQYRTEAFAITGDVEAALAALAAADGNGLIDESWIDRCPALARIRGESAFGPIADRVRDRAAAVREVLSEG